MGLAAMLHYGKPRPSLTTTASAIRSDAVIKMEDMLRAAFDPERNNRLQRQPNCG